MTHRPEITAANYKEVYGYYQESRLKPHVNNAIYWLSDAIYRPDVFIDDQAREAINAQLALGKGALIAMNHPSHHDPFVSAGGMHGLGIPEFMDCTAFAKDSLFRGLTIPIFEYTGCVPVFRHKSYENLDGATFKDATKSLLDLAADRLRAGQTVSILPEGTTSRPEALTQLKMSDIKSGIARVALDASDEHSFIVPIAISYRHDARKRKLPPRHAIFTVGDPITEYRDKKNPMIIRRQVLEGMQAQLERANILRGPNDVQPLPSPDDSVVETSFTFKVYPAKLRL